MNSMTSSGCETTGDVAADDLAGGGVHAGGETSLHPGWERLVLGGDQVPGGRLLHGGTPMMSPKAGAASGCWTAHMARAVSGATSLAKCATWSGWESQANPFSSITMCSSAGETAGSASRSHGPSP